MSDEHTHKHCLFINRRAPHGNLQAWEALELSMITAAYDHQVTLLYMDDGVYQLQKNQDSSASGTRNFSAVFGALEDYGITRICVEQASLQSRGLCVDDLIVPVELIESEALAALMEQQDILLNN